MATDQIPNENPCQRRGTTLLIAVLLGLLTLAAYWGVWRHDFVNYDDVTYVTENDHVKHGLDWATVVWAFTHSHAFNYHPLTWISHALDCQLYGLKAGGHHVTNLVLHAANGVLLFLALRLLTGAPWRSGIVAALFAVHPLHVESVAWVAERKDVLSAFFGLLCLLAYARYVNAECGVRNAEQHLDTSPCPLPDRGGEAGRASADQHREPSSQMPSGRARHSVRAAVGKAEPRRARSDAPYQASRSSILHPLSSPWYCLALGFFALGLLSKPMLVTWPFVLLLLDVWPLNRVPSSEFRVPSHWKKLVTEKLPFFALTIVICGLTLMTQSKGMMNPDFLPFHRRIANALVAYAAYFEQLFWPTNMAIFYPHQMQLPASEVVIAAALLLVVTALALWRCRQQAYGVIGWCWYLGMLVPVVGFVQVGLQSRADRYTYLPAIGIFLMVVWGVHALAQRHRTAHRVLATTAAVLMVVLAGLAQLQMRHWRNSETLFTHAIAVTPNNYVGYGGLAIVQIMQGEVPAAITNLQRALEAAQVYDVESTVKFYMGVALQLQGKGLEALPYLEGADTVADHVPDRNYRLGLSYIEAGRLAEAEAALNDALAVRPGNPDFRLGLAALRFSQGRVPEAERMFQEIIVSNPEHSQAHRAYADFLLLQNRFAEAETQYALAVKFQKPDVRLLRSYATVLTRLGKTAEAVARLEEARKREPTNALVNQELADLLSQRGETLQAVASYDRALAADPKLFGALNNLAWILATDASDAVRNGQRAVDLAERACELTAWKSAFLMGTLAASYAEAGRFPDAVAMAARARDQARADKLDDVARRNEELRQLYTTGQPYREGK